MLGSIVDYDGKIGLGWRVKGLPENVPLMWHQVHVNVRGEPRLAYGDWRLVVKGKTLSKRCLPRLCEQGLHACSWLFSTALYTGGDPDNYALTAVYLGGEVDCTRSPNTYSHLDRGEFVAAPHFKLAAQKRTVLGILGREETRQLLSLAARKLALPLVNECNAPASVRLALESGEGLHDAYLEMRKLSRETNWLTVSAKFCGAWSAVEAALRSEGNRALRGVLNGADRQPLSTWLPVAREVEGEALRRMGLEVEVEPEDTSDLLPF